MKLMVRDQQILSDDVPVRLFLSDLTQRIRTLEAAGWKDLTIKSEYEHEYDVVSTSIVLSGLRPETDREEAKRLELADRKKAARESAERAEYERLKRRFEGK